MRPRAHPLFALLYLGGRCALPPACLFLAQEAPYGSATSEYSVLACLATGLNVCALVGWTGIPVSFDLILPWGLSPAAWWPQTSITTACSTLRRPIPLLKRDDSAWSKPRDFLSSALLRRPAMNPAVLSPNSGGEHLPPGKPCTLAVHCQPPEKGTPSAVLVFIDNGLRGTPAIPMAGAGPSSAPCITAP